MEFEVKEINYYPVKSMSGISVKEIEFDEFGPRGDRRFMLVDDQGGFVSQRKYPKMALLKAEFCQSHLTIRSDTLEPLRIPLDSFVIERSVSIWSDTVSALLTIVPEAGQVLSEYLGLNVHLAYMPDRSFRQVDREFFGQDKRVSFADGYPVLLANTASLGDLNSRLSDPVTMKRFRPNIVFAGDRAFQEDDWRRVKIGDIEFEVVKPCSRCVMTTVDEHGQKGREPLKTLATYRKNSFGVCFGQNLVHLTLGRVSVGDALEVLA